MYDFPSSEEIMKFLFTNLLASGFNESESKP